MCPHEMMSPSMHPSSRCSMDQGAQNRLGERRGHEVVVSASAHSPRQSDLSVALSWSRLQTTPVGWLPGAQAISQGNQGAGG